MIPLSQYNPYGIAIKKYLVEIIPGTFTEQTNDLVDRMVHSLVTKKDAERLIRLLGDLYQAGYNKAIEAASAAMEAKGMRLNVNPVKREPMN
ncbi:hypothetical protein DRQ00_09070 [candidate division KSB1 bacterium]|nr:MAG: hypothetical protein DRQ00_09070 [candidate division KSB1 bacterium]